VLAELARTPRLVKSIQQQTFAGTAAAEDGVRQGGCGGLTVATTFRTLVVVAYAGAPQASAETGRLRSPKRPSPRTYLIYLQESLMKATEELALLRDAKVVGASCKVANGRVSQHVLIAAGGRTVKLRRHTLGAISKALGVHTFGAEVAVELTRIAGDYWSALKSHPNYSEARNVINEREANKLFATTVDTIAMRAVQRRVALADLLRQVEDAWLRHTAAIVMET